MPTFVTSPGQWPLTCNNTSSAYIFLLSLPPNTWLIFTSCSDSFFLPTLSCSPSLKLCVCEIQRSEKRTPFAHTHAHTKTTRSSFNSAIDYISIIKARPRRVVKWWAIRFSYNGNICKRVDWQWTTLFQYMHYAHIVASRKFIFSTGANPPAPTNVPRWYVYKDQKEDWETSFNISVVIWVLIALSSSRYICFTNSVIINEWNLLSCAAALRDGQKKKKRQTEKEKVKWQRNFVVHLF